MKLSKRLISILLVLTLFALCSCGKAEQGENTSAATSAQTTAVSLPSADSDDSTQEYTDGVDFRKYTSVNDEVYAFIKIPGTNIEYPIVQSGIDDNYYLDRDWKRNKSETGSIFTQSANAREFTDPITVVYGHNTYKGDMFSELLKFQNKDFFDKNELFYIFIPGHILVYRVFSAHTYDDRHILNSYDFSAPGVLQSFQQSLLNPDAMEKNVREGVTLNEWSEVVVLSTCAEARSNSDVRYLVNGVLIKDVLTV